jgi:hypothetical protein
MFIAKLAQLQLVCVPHAISPTSYLELQLAILATPINAMDALLLAQTAPHAIHHTTSIVMLTHVVPHAQLLDSTLTH